MKISSDKINFKANIDPKAALVPQSSAENRPQIQSLPAVMPDYNVKAPIAYSYFGKVELPYANDAHLYKLANGQKVIVIPKEGSTIVKTYVNSGSMNEPDSVRGISHFIEHNLFNGSEGLAAGEFFKNVNQMGAETNASTSFAETNYYIQSHMLNENDLETKIKMHASMLETPKFAADMIEKEKGPVTSEINMITDSPQNRGINETIKTLYGIKTTSSDIIGGTTDNIKKLTREDVTDYYNRNYYPANLTTVISGEVNPDETIKLISKYFSSKNTNPPPRNYETLVPIEKTVRKDITSDKAKSASIFMGFNGPQNNNPRDKILFDALSTFLTGSENARLNKSLEKIHLSAGLDSERISTKPNEGRFACLSCESSQENVENALKIIYKEVSQLEQTPPTPNEMETVKKKMKMFMAQMFESSDMVNSMVGKSMLDNNLDYVTQYNNVVDNLSPADIVQTAKKYLDLNKAALTVVHPPKTSNVSFTGKTVKKQAVNLNNVNEFVLPNSNLHVVARESKNDNTILGFALDADVPANVKPGTSLILSEILNRGSQYRDNNQFKDDLSKQGIISGFSASCNGLSANAACLAGDATAAINSLKEVILNPRFTQENLDSVKLSIKENLGRSLPSPSENLGKELFPNLPYGVTNDEILKNIDSITMQDVQGLYAYVMQNASGKFSISAPNAAINQTVSQLSDFPSMKIDKPSSFKSYTPVTEKNVIVQSANFNQADVIQAYKFKTNGNVKDSVTVNLLNMILGGNMSSRLFSDLRETQKLAYRVNSDYHKIDDTGVLSLNIKTTTDNKETGEKSFDNLKKSLDGFNLHVNKLMSEKVSNEELENAKMNLKNMLLSKNESTPGKIDSMIGGMFTPYGISLDNHALEMVDKITADDIYNAANYVFKTNPTVSIVATEDTLKNNEEFLKALGNIKTVI